MNAIEHAKQLVGIVDRADCAQEPCHGRVIVTFTRHARPDERIMIEPRERPGPDWWRIEQVRKNDVWRTRGKDAVDDVALEDGRA